MLWNVVHTFSRFIVTLPSRYHVANVSSHFLMYIGRRLFWNPKVSTNLRYEHSSVRHGCIGKVWYCCNLSGGVVLIVWFTTNGMCAKNKNICMWREQAIIEWSGWSDLGEWPLMMLVSLVNSWLCLLTVTTRVISSG